VKIPLELQAENWHWQLVGFDGIILRYKDKPTRALSKCEGIGVVPRTSKIARPFEDGLSYFLHGEKYV